MAPRPLETKQEFVKRLKRAAAAGEKVVAFGAHHFTHAACHEDGAWRVRRLEYTQEEAEAYRQANNGMFMPESAEEISRPRTLVFEAPTLEGLIAAIETHAWPW